MKKFLFFAAIFFIASFSSFPDIFHPLQLVREEGSNIVERIETPHKFKRTSLLQSGAKGAVKESFAQYIRNYPLLKAGSPVLLYNGCEKQNQDAHCAVFALELPQSDIQRAAASVIRLYAEYMYSHRLEDKISFYSESGEKCSWLDWKKNADRKLKERRDFAGNYKKWTRYEKEEKWPKDAAFQKYLRNILSCSTILSFQIYESEPVTFEDLRIGDVLWDLGGGGGLCMVVDMCEHEETGEKALLLAQGGSPSQSFHVIKNPKRVNDPWYYEEDFAIPAKTPEYVFPKESWRHVRLLDLF